MGDRYRRCIPRWQFGRMGSGRGGGWEIKNATCRKLEDATCRKHGDLMKGEAPRWYMYGGFTGP